MAILDDDWSPFLTLEAVFDCLNQLLEEPDVQYAATTLLKLEYMEEPEKYLKKMENIIKGNTTTAQNHDNSFS